MKINTLHELFASELCDIYDAEVRLAEALTKMMKVATDDDLSQGFSDHLEETKGQIDRLNRVFKLCDIELKRETCEAMKGLIDEGEELIKMVKDEQVLDAALITAAQKVEHYEIATYGSLCALARCLGYDEAAEILHETLEEEKRTDEKLTELAKNGVNDHAFQQAA